MAQPLSKKAKARIARQRAEEEDARRKARREGKPVSKRHTLTPAERAELGRRKGRRKH